MMNYEIGQIFAGKYPPEAALWANANGARIVRHGAEGWLVERIPAPTEEEKVDRKRREIRTALDAVDWRSMREHDRLAQNPAYGRDERVFAYKQFLRDFEESVPNWLDVQILPFEEWILAQEIEE
jgi:hypothetical protein